MQFAEEHQKLLAVFADAQRDQRDFDRVRESFDGVYSQESGIRRRFCQRKIVHSLLHRATNIAQATFDRMK